VRRFRLTVAEGAATGQRHDSVGDRCSIGSQPGNDLHVADPTVSRYHCEIVIDGARAAVVDLSSKNGTVVDGVQVKHAYLRDGSLLRLGATAVRFELVHETNRLPASERTSFGRLVGQSRSMRTLFGVLERAAASDATVLLEGETGTGKTEAAEALHRASGRGRGPFVVVDCGAIPENLLESELFGHEKGAFTGAVARRIGAFEEASGGTIFLDEIGEMPPSLQPKLLRALEAREIRRVGAASAQKVDVRIVAATNRDLRAEVNAGRFRADLYFRLAVVRVSVPALRERPEDLPMLARELLRRVGADDDQLALLAAPGFADRLAEHTWPGNIRELRNYLERCLVFQDVLPTTDGAAEPVPAAAAEPAPPAPATNDDELLALPLPEARERAVEAFERRYLADLVARHGGRMTAAAAAAGIGRVYLYKLLVRHRLKTRREPTRGDE